MAGKNMTRKAKAKHRQRRSYDRERTAYTSDRETAVRPTETVYLPDRDSNRIHQQTGNATVYTNRREIVTTLTTRQAE
jgi:hypothetical protein